ncbi:MAG TPA: PAS domain S-box protein, partial [Chitinophagaceae bacterium]|nr:PAS domain S-box protein [Chitinophagaceae bacterium]
MSADADSHNAPNDPNNVLSAIALKYKAILDSNMDAVVCMDTGGKIFSWNPQAEKLFGWPASEITGKTVSETIVPLQFRDRHIKGLQHYISTGEGPYLNKIIEISALNRSGHLFPVELTIIPLAEDGIQFFCAFIRDITLRKNAEASMQLSLQRLKVAETIGKTGYWHWDLASGLVSWSAGTYTVFGETEGNFKGNFDDFINRVCREDRDRVVYIIQKVLETRQSAKYEFWIYTSTGEKKYLSTTAEVILDDNGNIVSMFGTTHDDTEWKKAREKENKHHKQQQILAGLNEAVNKVQSPEEIYELAIDTLHNTINACKTSILLFDNSNVMRFVASRNLSDEYKRAAEGHSPWTVEEQNAKPIFVQDATREQDLAHLLPVILKEQISALGFIPLIHQNKLLGKFMVYFSAPHHFEEEEIQIMQSIASIVAFAIWEKKSTIALRDSEEKYRAFFENSLDGILLTKPDGTILAANPAACRMFGRSEEELCRLGRSGIADFSDPRMYILLEERMKKGKVSGEMNFVKKDGTIFPGEISSMSFIDAAGLEKTSTIIRDITIRKRAEEELQKSEEQYRDLVDNITDLICTHDLNGRVLSVNKATEQLMGYKFNPRYALNIRDILSPGAAAHFATYMKTIVRNGWANGIMKVRTKAGQIRIWEYHNSLKTDGVNEPVVRGYARDITEQMQAEEKLRRSEELLLASIENTPNVAVQWYNRDAVVVFWNRASENIFGFTSGEAVGKTLDQLIITPEAAAKFLESLRLVEKTGQTIGPAEYSFTRRNGSVGYCISTIFSISSVQGESRFVSMDIDITESKKAGQELKDSEEKYRSLIEQASDGILVTDLQGTIVELNSMICKMSGFTKEEMISQNASVFVEPQNLINQPLRLNLLKEGESLLLERKSVRKDGTVFDIELSTRLIGENRAMSVIRDISERKRAEQMLRESEEKYRILIEQASDPIVIYSLSGKIIDCNNAFTQVMGYQKGEIEKLKVTDMFFEKDIKEKPLAFGGLKKGYSVHDLRMAKRKDGSPIPVELNSKMMPDGNIMVIGRDITDRQKAQNEIIREKNLSDSIINSLPGVFYLFNRDGKFLRWNKNFETVTKYSVDEIREIHPLDLFEGKDKELIAEKIANVFNSGIDNAQADFLLKTKEKIPYYFTGIAIDYEGNPCLIGVGIDFSERVKAQEKIKETTAQLRQLTEHLQNIREEERKHIAREIHDELGQQLTVMKMDISWISKKLSVLGEVSILEKAKELMEMINQNVKTIRRISSELRPSLLDDLGL